MRILWNSSTPIGQSGYGICTRELVRRLVADGHFVRIATKHVYFGWHEWEGVEIFDGTNITHNKTMIEEEKFDYIFSHWDIWMLNDQQRYPREKWVGYIPVDTEWISKRLSNVVKDVGHVVAISQHGKRELETVEGIGEVIYAPHGVDVSTFKPDAKARKLFRDSFEKVNDDTFVIGSIGLNYIDDRKGFVTLLRAFKEFHEQHENSMLYIHTHAKGVQENTINLVDVAYNLGIEEAVAWAHETANDLHRIDDEWLAEIYNGFDVFCLPTSGEGFGLPLIEAQACGVPVIVTDTTTGEELGKAGFLIEIDDDRLRWLSTGTWRYEPAVSAVLIQLKKACSEWDLQNEAVPEDCFGRLWGTRKRSARAFALGYDWDTVYDKYWRPLFASLEKKLETPKLEVEKSNG